MQNTLTVSIKPYTNKKGVTTNYMFIEGQQVYGGKLLLNAPSCEAILANTDKLRLFVAEHAEAKPQPKAVTPPTDVSAIVALLQNNPNVVAALQTVASHQAGSIIANGRFNPAAETVRRF